VLSFLLRRWLWCHRLLPSWLRQPHHQRVLSFLLRRWLWCHRLLPSWLRQPHHQRAPSFLLRRLSCHRLLPSSPYRPELCAAHLRPLDGSHSSARVAAPALPLLQAWALVASAPLPASALPPAC
jgi:hypothetical protein